jgi:hypothetical protein
MSANKSFVTRRLDVFFQHLATAQGHLERCLEARDKAEAALEGEQLEKGSIPFEIARNLCMAITAYEGQAARFRKIISEYPNLLSYNTVGGGSESNLASMSGSICIWSNAEGLPRVPLLTIPCKPDGILWHQVTLFVGIVCCPLELEGKYQLLELPSKRNIEVTSTTRIIAGPYALVPLEAYPPLSVQCVGFEIIPRGKLSKQPTCWSEGSPAGSCLSGSPAKVAGDKTKTTNFDV